MDNIFMTAAIIMGIVYGLNKFKKETTNDLVIMHYKKDSDENITTLTVIEPQKPFKERVLARLYKIVRAIDTFLPVLIYLSTKSITILIMCFFLEYIFFKISYYWSKEIHPQRCLNPSTCFYCYSKFLKDKN